MELFTRGAVVNRMWGDMQEADMLAAFQYTSDAMDFAKMKLAEDAKRDFLSCAYAVADHSNGKLHVFGHSKEKAAA